jgi:hypothetical protein
MWSYSVLDIFSASKDANGNKRGVGERWKECEENAVGKHLLLSKIKIFNSLFPSVSSML